jgi:uncharacterized damage-inducible protein DinB
MAAPAEWAARRFEFPFGAEVYPAVLMRLRGTPTRLEELLRAGDYAKLRLRPEEGKWSPIEHAGHLIQIEYLWDKRLGEYLSGAETLTAADMSNKATFEANYSAHALEDVLKGFRASRQEFLRQLDKLKPEHFARTAMHPRLQVPMRLVDGLYFSAEHDDHHLAWIWELLRR